MRAGTLILSLALCPALIACNRDRQASPPVATPPAATTPATADDAAVDAKARYACDAGVNVAILADGKARVTLPGGQPVGLGRIAGSDPPVYTGSGLYLTLGDGVAHLSQDDGRELACASQAPPAG